MALLRAVTSQPGRPLYLTVRDAVHEAIDAGVFQPGKRMPSTKKLSEQLHVSLVTAHRALQELVVTGVVQRSQGKGTFVHRRYHDRRAISAVRIGLIIRPDASLANYLHLQILEGIRQAVRPLSLDLLLLSGSEDIRNECDGFLFLSPSGEQIEAFLAHDHRKPALIIGATSRWPTLASIDVNSFEIARQALDHLRKLGHRRIGYVGKHDNLCIGRDQWDAFFSVSHQMHLMPREDHIIRCMSWSFDEREQSALLKLLSGPSRPTAIFSAGIELALGVYRAAADAMLRIPHDLSVIALDDPPSAPHWNPPITTIRQPLCDMGQAAVNALFKLIQHADAKADALTLPTELVVRSSTAVPAGK
ncbi:MAG TPA: GntR family transcriptional regulator [Tepidisphaeraceae bacterium]|jgi:DNA-binding LacI/PurR family transcriptional regulator|nr:GntR family transcriptional regulator [Tepidisphaeraceae bacterium]